MLETDKENNDKLYFKLVNSMQFLNQCFQIISQTKCPVLIT